MNDVLLCAAVVIGVNWVIPVLLSWTFALVMTYVFRDYKFEGFYKGMGCFRFIGKGRVWWNSKDPSLAGEYILCGKNKGGSILVGRGHDAFGGNGVYYDVPAEELNFVEPWHLKLWLDWGGLALAGVMFYKDQPGKQDDARVARTKVHESAHGLHQWILGAVLFFISYFSHMLWIFVTQKLKVWLNTRFLEWQMREVGDEDMFDPDEVAKMTYTKHPYYDCWSERLARKAAGQTVDITPDRWSWGKKDLWPWW